MKLREIIMADLVHSGNDYSSKRIIKAYWKFPTFRVICWLRICQYFKEIGGVFRFVYPVVYFKLKYLKNKYGVDVNVSTPTGPGLTIVHGGAVYLNAECIGKNCTFFQGVTLGARSREDKRRPIIEDCVTVYTGAVVAGNVTLHKGCVVAANSVVIEDVPEYTLVSGVPAKVIKRISSNN